jgi:4-hydroxyphenylpyruvate dioxygenase
MEIDSIHFYVRDAIAMQDLAIAKLGLPARSHPLATAIDPISSSEHTLVRSVGTDRLSFSISSPLKSASPVADYLQSHPSGVRDVAFAVADLDALRCKIDRLGIEIIAASDDLADRSWLKIRGWGTLEHTLIDRPIEANLAPRIEPDCPIAGIDHIVLNVAAGELAAATDWYRDLFGFEIGQTFNVRTEISGLASNALVSPNGKIRFNINEPSSDNSQIQEFLDFNGGAGIQHIALQTHHIFETVERMQRQGLAFLPIPQTYYTHLRAVVESQGDCPLSSPEWERLERLHILMDRSTAAPKSLLLQIFTQPIFEAPTFFFEVIERRHQAQGFGQGNFQALFAAIEHYNAGAIVPR